MVGQNAGPLNIVDTRDQDEVILVIDAARLRKAGLDEQFARIVGDLVLGMPVAGCEMDQYGLQALLLVTEEECAMRDRQADLFDYERAH
jgi:hypothetical protein